MPEFGNIEVGWAMCKNPMCEHFGQFFDAVRDRAGNPASRYRVARKRSGSKGRVLVQLKCRGCGLSAIVHAGPSLRPVARHFLSQSLPFADCANDACSNHGVNAFEHLGRRPGPEGTRYRVNGPHTLICAACADAGRKPTHFSIGEPVELSDTRDVRSDVRWIIRSVREHLPVTAVRGLFGIPVGSYYRRLFRLAVRVGDYLNWRNAYLLSPEFRRAHGGTARVYTDVLNVSLHQVGDVARSRLLRIIVSVVGLEKTHFVLAAHPYFLPESKEPGLEELERDHGDDNYLTRRWDCLDTVLGDAPVFDEDEDEVAETVPSEGHAGFFLKSPYAEVAHFLTVDKMLSGFARRYYTMDAARDLFQSALVAMRRPVLDKEVEIALFQYRHADDSRKSGKEGKKDGNKAGMQARAAKPRYGGRKRADEATLRKA